VKDWMWMSEDASHSHSDTLSGYSKCYDNSFITFHKCYYIGISVSSMYDDNVDITAWNIDTGLTPSEVLYTAKGAQGLAISDKAAAKFSLSMDDYTETFTYLNHGSYVNDDQEAVDFRISYQ
jgi:hypothetical protein